MPVADGIPVPWPSALLRAAEQEGRTFLFYAACGNQGIAAATLAIP